MLNQHEKQHPSALLITHFLATLFQSQIPPITKSELLAQTLAEELRCEGFPEFNPQNPIEFSGFLNYLLDVFQQPDVKIELLLTDNTKVLIHFQIQGNHHEEFMGLAPASGLLLFNTNILFKLQNNRISEVVMGDKKVTLTTNKGAIYKFTGFNNASTSA